MRDIIDNILRFLTLICLLIMVALLLHVATDRVEGCATQGTLHEPTEAELAATHRYHGINYAEQDPDTGEWYFERDGKKISLFIHMEANDED